MQEAAAAKANGLADDPERAEGGSDAGGLVGVVHVLVLLVAHGAGFKTQGRRLLGALGRVEKGPL